MQTQTETVVQAAQAILERKQKLESVIRDEVAKLGELIAARLQTERAFRRLEAAAAIGEPAPGLEKARKAAADARAALDQASLRLNGFRSALGEQGTELVTNYDAIAAELPRHNAAIVAEFSKQWETAAAAWGAVLGRRAAIETVLGQRLKLAEPKPTTADLGDMAKPAETLGAINAALKVIASMTSIAARQLAHGVYYDRNAIYKLTSDRMSDASPYPDWRRGLPKGSLVVDASFESGRLAQLLELEECRLVQDSDIVAGLTAAAAKVSALDKAAREKEREDSERQLYQPVSEDEKRSGRLHDPSVYYEPTPSDLARAAEKQAQIDGRSIGPNDQSNGAR
jgi:hypothetical protein